ncbi:unnamed protein product [Aphanomyces euteiches]|uniref:Vps72/YL1 N-terminal domain-containing protein n=1 Tax=Aphanomyces euteiches TaxID=100861 RepID=A0A6G0XK32_9STRA|nr:hypothetical protein Ae201684_004079 [Aphanomyces euteiches]KAH9094381.1 hypothetical protein Ae201684P_016989 [Aphanomyces euteiches]KAH9153746.1 hypothetical protein AeRB84_004043 [Aphanomyces euteiches]
MSDQYVLPNRSSRGSRIHKLIGEAAEADEAFWGHEVWQEEEDEDYSSEEEEEDVVDSDFDEDENPDEDVHDGEVELKRQVNTKKRAPKTIVSKPATSSAPRKPRTTTSSPAEPFIPQPMGVRSSTVQKRVLSQELQQKYADEARSMQEKVTKPVVRVTQAQLLQEAVQTEVENLASLNRLERLEEEKRMIDEIMPKAKFTGPVVRYYSAIGKPKLISFLNVESFPDVFTKRQKVE